VYVGPDAGKQDAARAFVTQVIDPQAKHTLTLPTNYGCILVLREKPVRVAPSPSGLVTSQYIGKGKELLIRTGPIPGTVFWHFWFDNAQSWNQQEDLFTLAIRVEARQPTAKPIDPATYKDIPLITSIIPPEGELTIGFGATRLLILKEPLSKVEPQGQLDAFTVRPMAPRQLLIDVYGRANRPASINEVLTLWFSPNPEGDPVHVVNYLIHIVDDAKEQKGNPDSSAGEAPALTSSQEKAPTPQSQNVFGLAKFRRDTASELYRLRREEFKVGRTDLEATLSAAKRLLDSELELARNSRERVKAHQNYLQLTQENEALAKKVHEAGQLSQAAYLEAQYLRAEAEFWLAKEKAKP
jgi:hypothetical protein